MQSLLLSICCDAVIKSGNTCPNCGKWCETILIHGEQYINGEGRYKGSYDYAINKIELAVNRNKYTVVEVNKDSQRIEVLYYAEGSMVEQELNFTEDEFKRVARINGWYFTEINRSIYVAETDEDFIDDYIPQRNEAAWQKFYSSVNEQFFATWVIELLIQYSQKINK